MKELLDNPFFQSGIAPFLVSLILAAVLRKTRFVGLAVGAGFLVLVALALDFSFESLTATRKMVIAGTVAVLLIIPLELFTARASERVTTGVLTGVSLLAAAAAVWTVLRILQYQESGAWKAALAVVIYMAALVGSSAVVSRDTVRGGSTALLLGLGGGVLAWGGASALLSQVGIAVGAAAGGALLIQMITGQRAPTGWTLALPASVVTGLISIIGVATGELRWYFLLPTLLIPWATRFVDTGRRPLWVNAFLTSLAALVPVLLAVAWEWALRTPSAP